MLFYKKGQEKYNKYLKILETISQSTKEEKKFIVAKINMDYNDISSKFEIKETPQLKLYTKNYKNRAPKFTEEITEENILKFITKRSKM